MSESDNTSSDRDWQRKLNHLSGVAGRIGIAVLFLAAAHYHLAEMGWQSTLDSMTRRGIPFPAIAMWIAMLISSAAALGVLFDIQTKWSARILAAYAIIVSWVMYDPFATATATSMNFLLKDISLLAAVLPPKNPTFLTFFLKDLAIAGGLLAYASALPDRPARERLTAADATETARPARPVV